METKNIPILALFGILFMLCFQACKLDPNWETDWEAPLAKTTLTPSNILPVGEVQAASDGKLNYVFDKNVFTLPVDSVLNIPDTSLVYSFTAPLTLNVSPGAMFVVYDNYLDFNITQANLLEAILSEGMVELQIFSYATQPLDVKLEIPKAVKNGQAFMQLESMSASNGSKPALLSTTNNLNGYFLDFSGDNNNLSNKLRLRITAYLPTNAQPFTVNAGTQLVGLTFNLKGLKPHYARGKIKTQTISFTQDTLHIQALNMIQSGSLQLQDILMNLKITNGVGVDLRVKLQELTGINTRTGNVVALQHPIIGGVVNINRAINQQWNNPEYISTVQDILFQSSNSNLVDFVENIPDKIKMKADFIINPNGPSSGGNDFIYAQSKSEIRLRIDAPFSFGMDGLLLSDTVKADMAKLLKSDQIKELGLTLWAENFFPLAADAQLYFEDEWGQTLDSLLFQTKLDPAVTDMNNESISPVVSELTGSLSESALEHVRQAVRIRFKIKFQTSGQPALTHWKDNYYMHLKLKGQLKYNI